VFTIPIWVFTSPIQVFTMADLTVHDPPIEVFTMVRSRRSRWSETRTQLRFAVSRPTRRRIERTLQRIDALAA